MALRKQSHATLAEASAELKNLEETKEEKITVASRAPNSGDKGKFWLNEDGGVGARLYYRHSKTGTWTAV